MSSKPDTDQAVDASHGEDQRSPTVVVILMPESDPAGIPTPQTSKNVAEADARKLLSVVAIELAFVFLVTSGFYFNKTEDICTFVKSHQWDYTSVALIVWIVIVVIYTFYVVCSSRDRPLLGLGNVVIFIITTLCVTVVCVFTTICADGEMIIQSLGCTLSVLLLVIVVAVLTPFKTTGWGCRCQLGAMNIALGVAYIFIYLALKSSFSPVNAELQGRIILIVGIIAIIDVILCYFYILHLIQTIVGGKMDKEDGWFNACFILYWILRTFIMPILLCGLMQALQATKSP